MNSSQDTARHTCFYCQSEVLTGKSYTPLDEYTRRLLPSDYVEDYESSTAWLLPMRHTPEAVREAAFSGCPFFLMLWKNLDTVTSPESLKHTVLAFELAGVELEQAPVNSSKSGHDNLLVPVDGRPSQKWYDITKCTVVAITQGDINELEYFTAVSDWDDPSADHALARLVDGHTSSSQAIGQVRRQLRYCLAHHNGCKAVFSGIRPYRFLSVGEPTDPTVKVIRAQSLENGNAEPYAALSYCWGQDQVVKTTSKNKAYVEDGILLSSLPKTITDAIRVTRDLGIKLLWVDSLCLVQDEKDELAREIAKMHHYYSNAHITISAATSASCNEGFLQDHAMPRIGKHVSGGPFYFPVDLGFSERLAHLKLFRHDFESQAIDSRAWTLQEGLLSHRLISFSSRFIRWSCRTESYGDHPGDNLRRLHDSLIHKYSETDKMSDAQMAWRKLEVWCDVVESYTRRHLSNQNDKLPAISGIASVLSAPSTDSPEPQHQVDFVAGLLVRHSLTNPLNAVDSSRLGIKYQPQDHFESGFLAFQLLWHAPSGGAETPSTGFRRQEQSSQAPPYLAPSWSWASHVDAVGTAVSLIPRKWSELLSLTAWEQGLRVREVITVPKESEAPYGALSWGSITLHGYIFRPHEEHDKIALVAFDDGRRDIAPSDCSGLFCLQIVADIDQHIQPLRVSELCKTLWGEYPPFLLRRGLRGILLEPVESESRFLRDKRVYRRVGVYYTPGKPFRPFRNDKSSAKELRGRFETITIV